MSTTKQTLLLFWQHASKYPKHITALFGLLPVTLFVHQFLPPLIAARVLDKLSTKNYDPNDIWGSFGSDLIIYAVALIAGGVFLWRVIIIIIWSLESAVTRDLTRRMFDHLMVLSANFHANTFGGSLVSQTNKLNVAYIRIADIVAFNIYLLFIAVVFTSIVIYPKAPLYVLILWIFTILYISVSVFLTKNVRKLTAKEAEAQNKTTGVLADAITNIMAIKSFASNKSEHDKFYDVTEKSREATLAVMRAAAKKDLYFSSFTTSLGIVSLVIAVISVSVYNKDISTIYLMLAYTSNLGQRLWDFNTTALRNYNRAIGDSKEAVENLLLEPSVKDPEQPEKVRIKQGLVTFSDVTFTHNENDDALFNKLNITIQPGEKIGLVGHSGSGKTTLTRLLLRFSDIDDGHIYIDGQDISSITQNDLRAHIVYVPQEPLLFHRTLAENISYGKPNATQAEIVAAAKKANAHEFIKKLPLGYKTLVGERGVKLSGGQRQRVVIARAMLKNAPLLVLDEATSALDSESEKLIQQSLWKLMEGRTAIVIAHRLSTIQRMDRIIVLDNGHIAEEGTHSELIANNGIYASLWSHQSGGFIEE